MTTTDPLTPFRDLGALLRPQSVAIVGASEQRGNLGGVAVSLMLKFGFKGTIWPVNPKRPTVHGLTCYPDVASLPAPADLAVIATGAERAAPMVRECAAAGIRYGIIWAGGYAEVGPDGVALQEELLAVCRETGFTIVGPNCIGVINSRTGLVASFASFLVEADTLVPGDVAMISQSGGLATMAQALAQERGIGFGLTVSAGNEAMLSVADYIHAAAADDAIKVIAVYLEGVRDGPRFVRAVSRARAAGKPVVVLKGGLGAASAQAAAAHTGAFAGEGRVWKAVAEELGIVSATSLEELLDVCLFLSRTDLRKLPRGNRVAVISFGGGSGVLSADQCDAHGLRIAQLLPETAERLRPLVPPIASIQNPIDLTPQTFNSEAFFATFPEALDVIAGDPGVDIVLCLFGPQAQRAEETARVVAALRERTDKTVCLAWPLAPRGVPEVLEEEKVFVFREYIRAIAALARLAPPDSLTEGTGRASGALAVDWDALVPSPQPGTVISEHECHRILAACRVEVARGELATSEAAASDAAGRIGFPLAVKGISSAVTHRAAAGLLALDISSEDALLEAYRGLHRKAEASGVVLEGVYLQQMIRGGLEVIVSAFRDPIFGTMVTCGSGGVLTEIIDDVVLARTPLDKAGARRLLERTRLVEAAGKLQKDADIGSLAAFVSHFSKIADTAPYERFVIELNPVKWSAAGAIAVDGLLLIDQP